MTIGIVTTSRADFGIYIPLLRAINETPALEFMIFAGGMHLSEKFGLSYKLIEEEGFSIEKKVECLVDDDSSFGVAESMGLTVTNFAAVWKEYGSELDLVMVLGDRFEMFAAAASSIPFNIPIAHLHGGETTLGAIDNVFRHAISSMAKFHFTSTEESAGRVKGITGSDQNVYNVGALGIEAMLTTPLMTKQEFEQEFKFNLDEPYILCTYHPETINVGENLANVQTLIDSFKALPERVLCTLPNADTEGSIIRGELLNFERDKPDKIRCFENLGVRGYYTAMKHCEIMMGNTSSGLIEAATFNKVVLDVGDRQKGRVTSNNIIHVENQADQIRSGYAKASELKGATFENVYGGGNSAAKIVETLLSI